MRRSLLLACFLAGCSSLPVAPPEERDSGPPQPADHFSHLPPVVPRHEPVTAAGNRSPYTVFGNTYQVMETNSGYSERGYASWYGSKFHGRHTSNGEVYNMYGLTAAHRSLPIPSYVRVRNLANGREIIVRVNDRGPFHGNRIIDLSWAAAAQLGFVDHGVAEVLVTAIDPDSYQIMLAEQSRPDAGSGAAVPSARNSESSSAHQADLDEGTYLQVAALSDPASLDRLLDKLVPMTQHPVEILDEPTETGVIYRVQVGPIRARSELNLLQTMLEMGGLQRGFMVRRDACAQTC